MSGLKSLNAIWRRAEELLTVAYTAREDMLRPAREEPGPASLEVSDTSQKFVVYYTPDKTTYAEVKGNCLRRLENPCKEESIVVDLPDRKDPNHWFSVGLFRQSTGAELIAGVRQSDVLSKPSFSVVDVDQNGEIREPDFIYAFDDSMRQLGGATVVYEFFLETLLGSLMRRNPSSPTFTKL